MSNKSTKSNKSKKMEMVANMIREEAMMAFKGWEFLVLQGDDGDYYVCASRGNLKGDIVHVICCVRKSVVTIKVISDGSKFTEEQVQQVINKKDFLIGAMGMNEELLMLECRVPFRGMETDIRTIVWKRMVSMSAAVSEIIMAKKE